MEIYGPRTPAVIEFIASLKDVTVAETSASFGAAVQWAPDLMARLDRAQMVRDVTANRSAEMWEAVRLAEIHAREASGSIPAMYPYVGQAAASIVMLDLVPMDILEPSIRLFRNTSAVLPVIWS